MRWVNRRESSNVEDRRGMSAALPIGGVGTLVLALVVYFLGGDPTAVIQNSGKSARTQETRQNGGQNDDQAKFVKVVLADTEDVWIQLMKQNGKRYREPKLVLFTGSVQSACGVAGSSTGPFYCPGDEKVYIDLSFYDDLKNRFQAPGDFAQAYVIAHEIGHHIQNLTGELDTAREQERRVSKTEANRISVRTELQADYYAGVWAHYAQKRGILEAGDIEEALGAASAIGDDRLQQQSQGHVVPDSFTHGTSAQRVEAFKRGFESGTM